MRYSFLSCETVYRPPQLRIPTVLSSIQAIAASAAGAYALRILLKPLRLVRFVLP